MFTQICIDECCRLMDELEEKIQKETDERNRLRLLGQFNAIKSFSYADFGIVGNCQGEWIGFLYPHIDQNGTLHFTFCSRESDLPEDIRSRNNLDSLLP